MDDQLGVPDPGFRRVLLAGTGALGVAFLPFWINWFRNALPQVELRVVLTRSACRFVSVQAVSALSGREVFVDEWGGEASGVRRFGWEAGPVAPHVELARWPDLVLVHPATQHFVGRYALGLADTPLLLALHATDALVGVAPALPPAAERNPMVQEHLRTLRARPGVVVAPTVPAASAATGEVADGGAAPLTDLLALCADRRGEGAAA
ncbi:phosphopantothenoylcysteine synthetase/decarboxylase [Kitasatospora sp. MAA19]|uniref:peptide terminal cysteine decarboxylase LxmD n=1 Tax=Kitasatospora sp. MAA19 TaxID=3035090 RepID=UPI002474FD93|nr:peptide terminal cysteine decarboxylase LxmD [Kitasatospora sp. MAA19]MDH6705825.1 phosphopantothenoylcysteine synthetase/decarboxylase [Kitasatospora sp. MAA19]